ncbi:hypothetical protein E4U32_003225 [Claviceps aff. humidiphila group G2b]|nr:hypothetical protein E4U32_003225 [Claviceps aff. humidiphila group G2b]
MQRTVKVRVGGQKWNKVVKKWFSEPKHHLVHDPNSSLRTGDVVSIVPGWPTSRRKRHVVKHIIAPFGSSIDERPSIPTLEECIADREAKKAAKDARKVARNPGKSSQRTDDNIAMASARRTAHSRPISRS